MASRGLYFMHVSVGFKEKKVQWYTCCMANKRTAGVRGALAEVVERVADSLRRALHRAASRFIRLTAEPAAQQGVWAGDAKKKKGTDM